MRKLWVLLLLISVILPSSMVSAESYEVSASVPFPVPTVPAAIDASLSGITVNTSLYQVFGTCQFIFPVSMVSIYRDGQIAGTVACAPNGTFRMDINVREGVNTLIARTVNLNSVYGPNSSAITITYVVPVVPSPVSNPTPVPSPKVDAASDLSVSTDKPFVVLTPEQKTVTVSVVVDGGATPYTVELNWGDGSVETRLVTEPGAHIFTHEYAKTGSYQAKASVTDVLGVRREQLFAIVTSGEKAQSGGAQSNSSAATPTKRESTFVNYWWLWVLILIFFLVGLFIGMYIMRRRFFMIAAKKKKRAKREKK